MATRDATIRQEAYGLIAQTLLKNKDNIARDAVVMADETVFKSGDCVQGDLAVVDELLQELVNHVYRLHEVNEQSA